MLMRDGFYTKEFKDFWKKRVSDVGMVPLVLSGLGFDPRSLQAAKVILSAGIVPKVLPISFTDQTQVNADGGTIAAAIKYNYDLLGSFNTVADSPLRIETHDEYGRSIGGRKIVEKIYELRRHFDGVRDVIVDIGGLPRTLFAPLLSYLSTERKKLKYGNLHVASLPDESLDLGIVADQLLEPNYVFGFNRPSADDKFVWIPIIGRNDPARLRDIYLKIEKNCIEVCPVLPFRPSNPRRIDDLMIGLRDVLFGEIRTFYNNILYVDHRSPFIVYREIIQLSKYYTGLLKDLPGSGSVKVLITPLDDKTSSVGAILAALEYNLPIIYSETINYNIQNLGILKPLDNTEPMEVWIAGEAYES